MRPGDIIVGGLNYGMGSSRPAARSLRNPGIAALIAESLHGLFFHNAVNYGLRALEWPGIHAAFEEGQTAEVSLEDFTVRKPWDRRHSEGAANSADAARSDAE